MAAVEIRGGLEEEVHVEIDPLRLVSLKLDDEDVVRHGPSVDQCGR